MKKQELMKKIKEKEKQLNKLTEELTSLCIEYATGEKRGEKMSEEKRSFSDILYRLKSGENAYRLGWNGIKLGKDMYVFLEPLELKWDEKAVKLKCFIFFDGRELHAGWMPSIQDILAEDWKLKQK